MQLMRAHPGRPFGKGFTLVELMIAMALVGMMTLLIYGLFVRTADSLTDVEQLSEALDQSRFGAAHVRTDLQSAGAQVSPNADVDPWFVDDPESDLIVHGIMGYEEWQDDRSLYDGADIDEDVGDDNRQSRFSGVVLVGAYNIPGNLSVSFPRGTDGDTLSHDSEMVVTSTETGMHRLLGYDPLDLEAHDGVDLSSYFGSDVLDEIQEIYTDSESAFRLTASLFRVTDLDGFSQVTSIDTATIPDETRDHDDTGSGAGVVAGSGHELDLELANLYFAAADEPAGFDPQTEDDVTFDAAFIDAYWYYVRPAVDDPLNLQLVRQRLDAGNLADNAGGLSESDLEGMTVGPAMVVAEYVVDFRVWFDCGDGDSFGDRWNDGWNPITEGCIGNDPSNATPEDARFGHIRLSTRTENENANRPHYDLADDDDWKGFDVDGDGNAIEDRMRTYQVVPQAEGSASVVTVQTSVELTNFALRNL